MTRVEGAVDIRAPADLTYSMLTDVALLPLWAGPVVRTTLADEPPFRAGHRFRQTIRVLGIELEIDASVIEAGDARIVYEARGPGGAEARMEQQVTPTADGARLHVAIDYCLPFGLAGRLVDVLAGSRIHRREVDRSLRRLAPLVEAAATPPPPRRPTPDA